MMNAVLKKNINIMINVNQIFIKKFLIVQDANKIKKKHNKDLKKIIKLVNKKKRNKNKN